MCTPNMARPPTLAAVLVLAAALLSTAYAYPTYWVSRATSCTAHPDSSTYTGKAHGEPIQESTISFQLKVSIFLPPRPCKTCATPDAVALFLF